MIVSRFKYFDNSNWSSTPVRSTGISPSFMIIKYLSIIISNSWIFLQHIFDFNWFTLSKNYINNWQQIPPPEKRNYFTTVAKTLQKIAKHANTRYSVIQWAISIACTSELLSNSLSRAEKGSQLIQVSLAFRQLRRIWGFQFGRNWWIRNWFIVLDM